LAEDVVNFQVGPEDRGQRLDRYLTAGLSQFTRSALGRMIAEGRVIVDGVPAPKAGFTLEDGMRIDVHIPPAVSEELGPESIPIEVLHEDEEIVVVNKPAGLVVHPGHGRPDGTLVNALLGLGITLAPRGGARRPGIVHRLDHGTSGLLIVAKTDAAHSALSTAFAERRVRKTYIALVWGHPDPADGTIDRSIGRSRANPVKMTVHARRGREATTHYRTREDLPAFSLLDVFPETGRTHQIRVHLQSINHAIVGDARYGGRAWKGVQDPIKRNALKQFDRLALHAAGLVFEHPSTAKTLSLETPVPEKFEDLLQALRRS